MCVQYKQRKDVVMYVAMHSFISTKCVFYSRSLCHINVVETDKLLSGGY